MKVSGLCLAGFFVLAFMGAAALAGTDPKDATPAKAAALPWDQEARWGESAKDLPGKSRITIHAHFSHPDVVTDDEEYFVSFSVPVPNQGWGIGGHSSSRDGLDRWVNGAGHIEKVGKDGFDYRLSLSWQIDGKKPGKFDETFHCGWVKTQTFQKDGFSVTLWVDVN